MLAFTDDLDVSRGKRAANGRFSGAARLKVNDPFLAVSFKITAIPFLMPCVQMLAVLPLPLPSGFTRDIGSGFAVGALPSGETFEVARFKTPLFRGFAHDAFAVARVAIGEMAVPARFAG